MRIPGCAGACSWAASRAHTEGQADLRIRLRRRRDTGKRPEMAAISKLWPTMSSSPMTIRGTRMGQHHCRYSRGHDESPADTGWSTIRANAIRLAVRAAAGDVVLVAGKGMRTISRWAKPVCRLTTGSSGASGSGGGGADDRPPLSRLSACRSQNCSVKPGIQLSQHRYRSIARRSVCRPEGPKFDGHDYVQKAVDAVRRR